MKKPYAEERTLPGRLHEPAGLLAEAAALLEVVYERAQVASSGALSASASSSAADGEGGARGEREYYVSFAWHVAGDFLLRIKEARLARERNPERALFSRSL